LLTSCSPAGVGITLRAVEREQPRRASALFQPGETEWLKADATSKPAGRPREVLHQRQGEDREVAQFVVQHS